MHDVGGGALGLCKVSSRIFCIDLTIGGFRHSWRRLPIYINRVSNYTVYTHQIISKLIAFYEIGTNIDMIDRCVKGDKNRFSESQNFEVWQALSTYKSFEELQPCQWASQRVRGEHVYVWNTCESRCEYHFWTDTYKQVLSFGKYAHKNTPFSDQILPGLSPDILSQLQNEN